MIGLYLVISHNGYCLFDTNRLSAAKRVLRHDDQAAEIIMLIHDKFIRIVATKEEV